jgi:hypothetical protein
MISKERREWEESLAKGMLYVRGRLRRPKGWRLAHNHMMHTKTTGQGVNGFRYFWIAPEVKGFSVCRCGWRPKLGKHYSTRPNQPLVKRIKRDGKYGPSDFV